MILKYGDRVRSKSGGHEGRVIMDFQRRTVRVQFDNGRMGIFAKENDNRLELVDVFRYEFRVDEHVRVVKCLDEDVDVDFFKGKIGVVESINGANSDRGGKLDEIVVRFGEAPNDEAYRFFPEELAPAVDILALASAANEAAIAYREIAEKYTSYTGQREACEKLLRAVDALTGAIVEAENKKL